ncbi:aminodeoxychorismate lyase [Pinirhizobacter soli]|uniref:aminodeoxychorismate lyase n=1 Tax=Pinirhizobacter soli TaxID=2786953 RepID=UPI00202A56D5
MNDPARWRVDGRAATELPVGDRGLAYGDGLFETMRVVAGRAPLWTWHMERLEEGCRRLQLPQPASAMLADEVSAAADGLDDAVVRITWTAGSGPRGYARQATVSGRLIVVASPVHHADPFMATHGVALFECSTRWSLQPRLAGIKHLNRLEQVLARAEWEDPSFIDGLMLDMDDRVISTTAASIGLVVDGVPMFPALHRCGVAGVGRRLAMASLPDAVEADIDRAMLASASEVFLASSVRGMLPVRAIGDRHYATGPVVRALQAAWTTAGMPPLRPAEQP